MLSFRKMEKRCQSDGCEVKGEAVRQCTICLDDVCGSCLTIWEGTKSIDSRFVCKPCEAYWKVHQKALWQHWVQ